MFGNNSSSTTRDQHVFENIWGHTSELPPSLPISTIDQISPLSSPPLGIWIHSPQYSAKHVKDPQQSFPQQSFPQQSFPQESFPQHMSSQPSHSSNSPSVGQANISRHLPFNNSSDIPLECFPDSLTYPEYSSMGLTQSPSGNQYFMPIIHEATEDKFGSGWFHSHQDDTTSDKETSPDAEYLDEAEQEFVKIAPMLKDLTSKNMWVFLVHALSGIHQHIPLDDFFDLLYKEKPQGVLSEGTHKRQSRGLPRTVSLKLQGLKLCHLIIQTFENPKTTVGLHQNVFIRNSLISSTNMHELLRSFLAIKIIYSCVMKVSEFQSYPSSVPRISVYKLYYILCQLLMKKYPSISSYPSFQQNLIVGQSRFGKITRLVHPNMITRRLGKRKYSKTHYMGVTLNRSLIDEDLIKLLDLDLPQLKKHFEKKPTRRIPDRQRTQRRASQTNPNKERQNADPLKSLMPLSQTHLKKPGLSHVDVSYRYPNGDCCPRIWNPATNKIPQHSEWANNKLEKSLRALTKYNLDLKPLRESLITGRFYGEDDDSFSEMLVGTIKTLQEVEAPNQSYMHLHLIIVISIFPRIIASDDEVPLSSKSMLQKSVSKCVIMLEREVTHLSSIDETNLKIFTGILKRMVNLNKMTSANVKTGYGDIVIREMVCDIDVEINRKLDYFHGSSALESTFIRGVASSVYAYYPNLIDEKCTSEGNQIDKIINITKTIMSIVRKFKEEMTSLPQLGTPQDFSSGNPDIPYQLLTLAIKNFHGLVLYEPILAQLPIPVLTTIICHLNNGIHTATFQQFGNRDTELAAETFKNWWVFSTMYHEYLSILSEVVALSEILFECPSK